MIGIEIIAGLVVIAIVLSIAKGDEISQKLASRSSDRQTAASMKCKSCKGVMIMDAQRQGLYLLPIRFDTTHSDSAAYYRNNGTPIQDVSQIPSGQRAFRLQPFHCQSCGQSVVRVTDFLRVRDNESIFSQGIYPIEEFRDMLPDPPQGNGPYTG